MLQSIHISGAHGLSHGLIYFKRNFRFISYSWKISESAQVNDDNNIGIKAVYIYTVWSGSV